MANKERERDREREREIECVCEREKYKAEYFYFVCYSDFIGLFIVYLKKEERVYKSEKQCKNASFL